MKPWESRPLEVANLLNPAFCGRIIYQTVQAHVGEGGKPMPYALSFLVLPIVLHPTTRRTMNPGIRHLAVWLNNNQQIKVGLAARARSLVPHSNEALAFLFQVNAAEVAPNTASVGIKNPLRRSRRSALLPTDDFRETLAKATVLGKWFARTDSPATIYASFGLMP